MKGNIYNAIYGSARSGAQQAHHICPTSSCTWDRFATLAYCPRCIDVSEHLNHTCPTFTSTRDVLQYCNVSFPDGSPYLTFAAAPSQYLIVDTYLNVELAKSSIALNTKYPTSNEFPIWRSLRADVSISILENLDMRKKVRNDTRMIATECVMLPCILSIDAAVKNGSYQEQIVNTYYLQNISGGNGIVAPPWDEEDGIRPGETFGMTPEARDSARESLVDLTGAVREADGGLGISFQSPEIQAIFSAEYTDKTCKTPHDNFACVFNAIGSAM